MKIGLALGSGSARGWAHIGVIQALEELGIRPDVICGTSVGALVGAACASGHLERLEARLRALTRLNTATYFTIGVAGGGLVNREKLHALFEECVADPEAAIEDLPIKYAAVATDMETGGEYWLRKGAVLQAVWASISLPGLFPPVHYHDRWLFDGGLVNPVPVSVCRALGADLVIAVNLNGELVGRHNAAKRRREWEKEREKEREREGEGDFVERIAATIRQHGLFPEWPARPSMFGTVACAIDIVQDRITRSRMAGDPPDAVLTPRLTHIGLLEFYKAEEAIEEGKACVERMRPVIDALFSHSPS